MLPLTLAIWGFIGYKVYQYLNQDDDDIELAPVTTEAIKESMLPDSFVVFNNYRDPFLGDNGKELFTSERISHSSYSPGNVSVNNKNKKPKTTQAPVIPQAVVNTWPAIVYNGMITNSSTNQSMGFVSINGVMNKVKAGESVGELKVISFNQSELVVQRGKEKKVISK